MRRLAPLLSLLIGCATPTELVLVVDTNLRVPGELDRVEIVVTGPDGTETRTPQPLNVPDAPTFPLTLGIAPEDETLGPISIAALGLREDALVVRQDAEVTLESGRSTTLHLFLLRSCVGRDCPGGTCNEDGCVQVVREGLPDWDEEIPPIPDDPCLATAWDADGDGAGNLACGGGDCDDDNDAVAPSLPEDCSDGIDNDCSGGVDDGCGECVDGTSEACTTPCGGEGRRTCMGTAWGACAATDDVCNYLDDDCDGLTDEGHAYVTTDEGALLEGDVDARHPHLLWVDDRYLLAWDQARILGIDGVRAVHVGAFGRDGTPMGGPLQIHTVGESPRLAWSGSVFGVAWVGCDMDPTCTGVRFAVVAGDLSAVLGAQQQLDDTNDGSPRPRVVWDGASFVVSAYDQPSAVVVRWLAPDGTPPTATQTHPLTFSPSRPDLAPTGGGDVIVAYDGPDELFLLEGNAMGFPAMGLQVAVTNRVIRPAIVTTPRGSLSAWLSDEGGNAVHAIAVDPMGAPLGPGLQTLSTTRAPVRNGAFRAAEPAVAVGQRQVLVGWLEDDGPDAPHYARLARNGRINQGPTPISTTAPTDHAQQVTLSFDGAGFGAAWAVPGAGSRNHVRFARLVCPAP